MKSSLLTTGGLLAAAALALTGCASEPTLDESWPEVRQQFADAESVHMVMDGTGEAAGGDSSASGDAQSVHVDLAGATDDSYAVGSIQGDMGSGRMDLDLLRLDDEAYVKIKDGEQEGMDTLRQLVGDRWIKGDPEETGLSEMSVGSLLGHIEEDLPEDDAFDGKDIAAEKVELDGEDYLKYDLPDEFANFADVIYVDPDDSRLHRLEGVASDDVDDPTEATATFTNWNAVERPEAPAAEDVFDPSALSSAG